MSHSCNLCHSCSNARSLTHCAGLGIKLVPPQRQAGSLTHCAAVGTPRAQFSKEQFTLICLSLPASQSLQSPLVLKPSDPFLLGHSWLIHLNQLTPPTVPAFPCLHTFSYAVPSAWNTFPSLPYNANTFLLFNTKPECHFLREAFSGAPGWFGKFSKDGPCFRRLDPCPLSLGSFFLPSFPFLLAFLWVF